MLRCCWEFTTTMSQSYIFIIRYTEAYDIATGNLSRHNDKVGAPVSTNRGKLVTSFRFEQRGKRGINDIRNKRRARNSRRGAAGDLRSRGKRRESTMAANEENEAGKKRPVLYRVAAALLSFVIVPYVNVCEYRTGGELLIAVISAEKPATRYTSLSTGHVTLWLRQLLPSFISLLPFFLPCARRQKKRKTKKHRTKSMILHTFANHPNVVTMHHMQALRVGVRARNVVAADRRESLPMIVRDRYISERKQGYSEHP